MNPKLYVCYISFLIAIGGSCFFCSSANIFLYNVFLMSYLQDDKYVPDLQWKLVKWLKNHACMGTSQKDLKAKNSNFPAKAEVGGTDVSDSVALSDSDISDPVAVKSVPPRRRTKSNMRILKDNNIICSTKNSFNDNGMMMDGLDQVVAGEVERSTELSILDVSEKVKLVFRRLFKCLWHA